jgi:hypothetical protein
LTQQQTTEAPQAAILTQQQTTEAPQEAIFTFKNKKIRYERT